MASLLVDNRILSPLNSGCLSPLHSIQSGLLPEEPEPQEHIVAGTVAYQTPRDNPKEHIYRYFSQTPPEGVPVTNSRPKQHEMAFTDMRTSSKKFTLEKNGFELQNIKAPDGINWDCPAEIEQKYFPSVEQLLKKVTGCTRVHIFEEMTTLGKVEESSKLIKSATHGEPLPHCHVNFSAIGGPQKLEEALPLEAEKLKKTPFAVIQVWRPIVGPVESSPLGLIDCQTVDGRDFLSNRLIMPDRTQETYHVKHNPKHRWYYASNMSQEEAYVFVQYDSRLGRARFVPHAAFRDSTTPANAAPRQSVEVRALVFWEDLPQQPCFKIL